MNEAEWVAPTIRRPVVVHRIVQAGLFLNLVWKFSYFRLAPEIYSSIPLEDPFFPEWLRSAYTVSIAYIATVAVITVSFFTANRMLHKFAAWITILGTSILCVHQGSYNDMTFVTAWWTSLWSLWYVHRDWRRDQERLLQRAAFLSRSILSMILLGGAIGKWTGEYWSGEVFYDIYFRDRQFWLFDLLRANFQADTVREIATWYSRQVVVVETLAGFGLWLLPARWAAIGGMFLLAAIAILSNFLLFSVLSCLIALAAVGLFVKNDDTSGPIPS